MNIRNAVAADIPRIKELNDKAGNDAHWSDTNYQDLFTKSEGVSRIVLIGEFENKLIASLVANVIHDECELENVVVASGWHRSGIATRLLAELFRQAKESEVLSIHLEVRESNLPARRLYEKCGFQQQESRPKYYSNPEEDAVLYSISI